MSTIVSDCQKTWIGLQIGNYRLVRLMGKGGMCMVFEAVHEAAGSRVAVKVLRPEIADQADIVARFFNEARAANAIQHPGIVRIFDCGYGPDGIAFLAMEFLEGEPLSARLGRVQYLPIADVLCIGRQLATALLAAHRKSVIHRDLKPDNIMLIPDPEIPGGERVKILDFGIAKIAEGLRATPLHTHSALLMGTPSYMAPEQCRGAKCVTERSDVYSLGIILYQCLAGKLPFVGGGLGELLAMHMMDPVPSLDAATPHVEPELAALVHRMLAKTPQHRAGMEQVMQELQMLENCAERRKPAQSYLPTGSVERLPAPSPQAPPAVMALVPGMRTAPPEAPTEWLPALESSADLETRTVAAKRAAWKTGASLRTRMGLAVLAGACALAVEAVVLIKLRHRGSAERVAHPVASARHSSLGQLARKQPPTVLPSAALVPAPSPSPRGGNDATPTKSPTATAAPAPAPRPDTRLLTAQREYGVRRYYAAIDAANQIRGMHPLRGNRLLGLAACHVGNEVLVAEATSSISRTGAASATEIVQEIALECRKVREALESLGAAESAHTLADAERCYQSRFYERATFIAESHKLTEPLAAWEMIGRAACGLRVPSRASVAYLHVQSDDGRVKALIDACEQHGFSFSSGTFKPK